MGYLGGSDRKESACSAGDTGSTPGSGRFPGEGSGYLHQYSCLENSTDRGGWQATVHGVTESHTTQRLNSVVAVDNALWSDYYKEDENRPRLERLSDCRI